MRALLAAVMLFVAAPAFADSPGTSATLVDASTAPSGRVIVDGATWRCEGDACTATGGSNQPAARACRRTVAKIGPVATFSYKGQALNSEEIAVCNAG